MKKSAVILCTAAVATLSSPVYADVLGAKMGLDYFYSDLEVNNITLNDNQDNYRAYAAFEHFIPLIPNALLEYSTHGSDAAGFEQLSATAYYELLDNGLVAFDFGAGATHYSDITAIEGTSSETTPHAYIASEIMLPISNFSLFADAKFMGLKDVKGEEVTLGLGWSTDMILDLGVRVGYSISDLTFDDVAGNKDADLKSKGWILGVKAHF
ncbi:TIGR04219 family outer membrane beta-barrel protein [Oceanisphaera pacifica]|uniref:TIGR04219 family outer membrane beta-barrel protein n=1 Tax=Oceanisphaera pacifica TaxID=2818389 RepID=A0ABS3NEP8_9GAMM|nr:TIGR04219 family outer membrane beta-barrel protein [Oceanisphaera pacifica]MBO1518837.1 TIGR04219 family outer membrane beta-barrel protein [Oceanisphaera pacifica]